MTPTNDLNDAVDSINPVHIKAQVLMQDYAEVMKDMTELQRRSIYDMLQLAWNNGYKVGYEQAIENS